MFRRFRCWYRKFHISTAHSMVLQRYCKCCGKALGDSPPPQKFYFEEHAYPKNKAWANCERCNLPWYDQPFKPCKKESGNEKNASP